jgi:hypothetical protein
MSLYYSQSVELKIWEPIFEPLLDLSQWSEYGRMYYVPDVVMHKIRKGRCKKKQFRNVIDDMENGYRNDMYGLGDFDQIKNKVRCYVCHTEGHTMTSHNERPKRNPRPRGATGRNRTSGATDIIEVTYTSNIDFLIYWYVVI